MSIQLKLFTLFFLILCMLINVIVNLLWIHSIWIYVKNCDYRWDQKQREKAEQNSGF